MRFALGFAVGLLLMTAVPAFTTQPPPHTAPQPTTSPGAPPTPMPTPPPPVPPSWHPPPLHPALREDKLQLECVVKPSEPPVPPAPRDGGLRVEPLPFDRAGAPWAAQGRTGCGFCAYVDGFVSPTTNRAFFLFANLRVLAVEWNVGAGPSAIHREQGHSDLAPISYDADELRELLGEGNLWVVRLWTGVVEGPAAATLLDDLARAWVHPEHAPPIPPDAATTTYTLRTDSGEVRRENLYGTLPAEEPFRQVQDLLARLDGQVRSHGALQGWGPGGSEARGWDGSLRQGH